MEPTGIIFAGLDCDALHGIELWNLANDRGEQIDGVRTLIRFLATPARALEHAPERNMRRWDELCRYRRVVAIGGLDAHQFGKRIGRFVPVRVMAWDGRRLVDETQAHKDRVRADLGRTWRLMRSSSRRGYEPRGAAAAWAANRYRLGKRQSTLRTLRRLARTDRLPGFPTRDPLRFVSALDRFLVRSGFAP